MDIGFAVFLVIMVVMFGLAALALGLHAQEKTEQLDSVRKERAKLWDELDDMKDELARTEEVVEELREDLHTAEDRIAEYQKLHAEFAKSMEKLDSV